MNGLDFCKHQRLWGLCCGADGYGPEKRYYGQEQDTQNRRSNTQSGYVESDIQSRSAEPDDRSELSRQSLQNPQLLNQVGGDHPPNLRLSRAVSILRDAGDAICERQITRDNGSEKSMRRTINVFHSLTGQSLMTESQGWLFMACVKLGRSQQGKFHQDDYTDAVAYIALAGEAAAKEADDGHGPEGA